MKKAYGLTALLLSLAIILAGCCHPPVKEISLAQAQLEEAKKAGALAYAPEKYHQAQNLLSQAQAEAKKACKKSWKTVKLAQQKAMEAKEAAIKAKSQARLEAKQAIDKAQKALAQAKKAQALRYAPDIYAAAQELLKKAQRDFQEEHYILSKREAEKATQLALKARDAAIKVQKELSKKREEEKLSKPTTYIVLKGECLWLISSYPQIYNNPFMWPLIYWANKVQIHDPDLIYPGQAFVIPRDFSEQEKAKAIYFAKHRGPWSLFDGK